MPKLSSSVYSIDSPSSETTILDPLGVKVEGWIRERSDSYLSGVEFWVEDRIAGATSLVFDRSDVATVLKDNGVYKGFAIFARAPWVFGRTNTPCRLVARFGNTTEMIVSLEKTWGCRDYRQTDYGSLLEPENRLIHHRANIYCSGPSSPVPSPECLQLVQRYLGTPPMKLLDVGCGIGAYGEPLLALGYDWMGVEIKASDCAELERRHLPFWRVDGRALPFQDKAFDSTISIEVLEHVENPAPFLGEICRVTRRRLIISVPNIEILPYMRPLLAAPWHILEADHKNFFTRQSLQNLLLSVGCARVEVIPYGVAPLQSIEGFPLYYHLLAVCDV
jgi:2-polyprenyl-3-methyl-5-hydroxy-6-metoxy-1,4-benzoquinol methylase